LEIVKRGILKSYQELRSDSTEDFVSGSPKKVGGGSHRRNGGPGKGKGSTTQSLNWECTEITRESILPFTKKKKGGKNLEKEGRDVLGGESPSLEGKCSKGKRFLLKEQSTSSPFITE